MELNHVLLWVVGTSAGFGFIAVALRHRLAQPGWLAVHAVTGAALLLLYQVRPDDAGFIGAAIWLPTSVAPLLLLRGASYFAGRSRFRWAYWLARVATWLHPFDGWFMQAAMLRALALAEEGRGDLARAQLDSLGRGTSLFSWLAKLQIFHVEGAWHELVRAVEMQKGGAPVPRDPAAAAMYVRALGELGEVDEMLRAYRDAARMPASPVDATLTLVVVALLGNPGWARQLARGALAARPRELHAFWLGTAYQRAGSEDAARELLAPLAERGSPLVRERARRRLEEPAIRGTASAAMEPVLRDIEARVAHYASVVAAGPPVATVGLVLLNVLVFLRQIPGGSTDPRNLVALGAIFVDPTWSTFEPWRVLTAAVLHFGWLHLTMNSLALLLFGRDLEALVGSLRTALLYLATGAGSLALATIVMLHTQSSPSLLVGASGGVMGLVGSLAGVALRRWISHRSPVARSKLWPLVAIIGLQVAFDASTPQVSMSAHLFGVAIGLVLGVALGGHAPVRVADSRRRSWAVALALVAAAFGAFEWRARGSATEEALPPHLACAEGRVEGCERACEAGHLESCARAAYALSQGEGVAEDDARAYAHYRRACDGGLMLACSNLGLMLRYGRGVEVDAEAAADLFERACDAGHPHGCTLLAEMLEDGEGRDPDPGRARALFEAACADGDDLACEQRADAP